MTEKSDKVFNPERDRARTVDEANLKAEVRRQKLIKEQLLEDSGLMTILRTVVFQKIREDAGSEGMVYTSFSLSSKTLDELLEVVNDTANGKINSGAEALERLQPIIDGIVADLRYMKEKSIKIGEPHQIEKGERNLVILADALNNGLPSQLLSCLSVYDLDNLCFAELLGEPPLNQVLDAASPEVIFALEHVWSSLKEADIDPPFLEFDTVLQKIVRSKE